MPHGQHDHLLLAVVPDLQLIPTACYVLSELYMQASVAETDVHAHQCSK